MSKLPLFDGNRNEEVIITPKQQIDNFKKNHKLKIFDLPENCVLAAMGPQRIESALLKEDWKLVDKMLLSPNKNSFPVKIFSKSGKKICLAYGGGLGAPALCNQLELLIETNVKNVYMIGMCGGISEVEIGDIVVPTEAIRDEGVSYHYLPKNKKSKASKVLLNSIKITAKKGVVWTIDAMYRETVEKYNKFKKQGILGVDMETASAYAVAEFRGIDILSFLIVSDIVKLDKWDPQFHSNLIDKGVENIIDVLGSI